jgi:hypothetical protein
MEENEKRLDELEVEDYGVGNDNEKIKESIEKNSELKSEMYGKKEN